MRNVENIWTAVAIALTAVIAGLDLVVDGGGFGGVLVLGPVVASIRVSARRTALVAVLAVVAALVVAVVGDQFGELNEAFRLIGVAVVGGVCVVGASWRQRREQAFQRVTQVAEVAQRAILRPIPARVATVALASRYLSAAEQAFIGGDLYEVVATPRGALAVIGDVRGKGLDAVQLAATVLGAFRDAAMAGGSLSDVAASVDRAVMSEISPEDFVTAVFLEFRRQGQVELVNCGHYPPLRFSGGSVEALDPGSPSPPLGLSPEFRPEVHQMHRGDRLLLYTDGLVEARSPDGSYFPLEHHAPAVLGRRSLETALETLVTLVRSHAGGRMDDDLALLLVEVRG
jgi:serine phosphatase RsbU (regulator of sigma subunit)